MKNDIYLENNGEVEGFCESDLKRGGRVEGGVVWG